jgi:hypothetical protein
MLHYYFFKYWSRGLVGTMIGVVFLSLGLFTYTLTGHHQSANKTALEAAQSQQTQTYQKSATLFNQIQELKIKKQDTSKLEALYSSSVQNLSNQHPDVAATQLHQLETQIAKINENLALTPTPVPSDAIASISGTIAPSVEPSEAVKDASFEGSGSAELK